MKYLFFGIYKSLIVSILLVILGLSACQKSPKIVVPMESKRASFLAGIDTSCEIGYWVLNLEAAAGLGVKASDYAFLDGFLEEISGEPLLQAQSSYTREEALTRLRSIGAAIGRRRVQQLSYHNNFSMCLRYKMFDCDINSLLFVSAAERLGLPIVVLAMPNHVSVLWDDGEQKIYWETTENKERSLDFYCRHYHIKAEEVGKSMLLEALKREQLIGLAFFNISKSYCEMKNYAYGLKFSEASLFFSHNWFEPYKNIAYIYQQLRQPQAALDYAQQALRLYPQSLETYAIIADAYSQMGCNTEAIQAYRQYLNRLPASAYNYTAMLEDIKGQIKLLDL